MNSYTTQEYEPEMDVSKRLKISLVSALVFLAVTPHIYTELSSNGDKTKYECQDAKSHLASSALFFALNYLLMKMSVSGNKSDRTPSDMLLVKYSLYATLLYYAVSGTEMYQLTDSLGFSSLTEKGCPSTFGILAHVVVFAVLLVLMMYLPQDE
jgi:hypothetical protein